MSKKFIAFIIILIMNYFSTIFIIIPDYIKVSNSILIIIILIIHYLIYKLLLKKYSAKDVLIGILLFMLANVALASFTYVKIDRHFPLSYSFLHALNFTVSLMFRYISDSKSKLFTILYPIGTLVVQTALFKTACYFNKKINN